jgi:predicted ATPase
VSALPRGTVALLCAEVWPLAHPGVPAEALESLAVHQRQAFVATCAARSGSALPAAGTAIRIGFARITDALAAVVEAMQAYREAVWGRRGLLQLRAALHAVPDGEPTSAARALERAEYLLDIAGPGQVLLSAQARDLARYSLPAGAALHDLGEQALRDLEPPERVYQLVHPALAAASSPPRALYSYPTNLPVQATPLVGRQRALAELQALLATASAVVLVGTAGVGKTRLALRLAAALLPAFPDGCWLVPVDEVHDGPALPRAVAAPLGLALPPGADATLALGEALAERQLLLVLDHCDPWMPESAAVLTALQAACPGVRVLATCREPLRVPGGVVWPVPALAVAEQIGGAAGAAGHGEAVELFCLRARAALPAFTLTSRNLLPTVQLCRRLDGLPLAIELVAAWTPLLPVERLFALVDERLRPLQRTLRLDDPPSQFLRVRMTAGEPAPPVERALPPSREQVVRAIMEWCYGQLTEAERLVLRRLAGFRGRFTLADAQAVAAGGRLSPEEAAAALAVLQARALVAREGLAAAPRYHLLPPVRQLARERLQATPEAAAVLARCRGLETARAP